jgi:hypothetical protein
MAQLARNNSKAPSKKIQIVSGAIFLILILIAIFVPIRQKSANDIFVLTPTESLEYGYTTLSGTIHKDRPAGESGLYFLVLADSRSIMLNMPGYDKYIGKNVTITGYLTPAIEDNGQPLMMVESIK